MRVTPFFHTLVATLVLGSRVGAQPILVYVSDSTNQVKQFTPGGPAVTVASGLNSPRGMAFDAARNLYVVNQGDNTVKKITPAGVVSTFASGFNSPYGLAIDSQGNLYVSNQGNSTISKVTPAGAVSTFVVGIAPLYHLAIDSADNLYVPNGTAGNGRITKITQGGAWSTFASGFNGPVGVTFDSFGNLYVSELGSPTIKKVTPAGSVSTFVPQTRLAIIGMDYGPDGYLYAATATDAALNHFMTRYAITDGSWGGDFNLGFGSISDVAVYPLPEPSCLILMSAGLIAFVVYRIERMPAPCHGGLSEL